MSSSSSLALAIEIDDAPISRSRYHDVTTEFVDQEHHVARDVASGFDLSYVIVEMFISSTPSVVELTVSHPEDIGHFVVLLERRPGNRRALRPANHVGHGGTCSRDGYGEKRESEDGKAHLATCSCH